MFCGADLPSVMTQPCGDEYGGLPEYHQPERCDKGSVNVCSGKDVLVLRALRADCCAQDARLHFFIFAESVKPFHAGFVAKPAHLSFRIMPDVKFGLFEGARQVSAALQVLDDAPIAMRAQRVRLCGHAVTQQG